MANAKLVGEVGQDFAKKVKEHYELAHAEDVCMAPSKSIYVGQLIAMGLHAQEEIDRMKELVRKSENNYVEIDEQLAELRQRHLGTLAELGKVKRYNRELRCAANKGEDAMRRLSIIQELMKIDHPETSQSCSDCKLREPAPQNFEGGSSYTEVEVKDILTKAAENLAQRLDYMVNGGADIDEEAAG